jgi:hypothetical protein
MDPAQVVGAERVPLGAVIQQQPLRNTASHQYNPLKTTKREAEWNR